MSARKLPNHIPGTVKAWRVCKRREWRAVMQAYNVFMLGCAYTPTETTGAFRHTLLEVQAQLRGNWTP